MAEERGAKGMPQAGTRRCRGRRGCRSQGGSKLFSMDSEWGAQRQGIGQGPGAESCYGPAKELTLILKVFGTMKCFREGN